MKGACFVEKGDASLFLFSVSEARGKEARLSLVGLVVNKKGEPLFHENSPKISVANSCCILIVLTQFNSHGSILIKHVLGVFMRFT